VGQVGEADFAGDGREVDDASVAVLAHQPQLCLAAEENAAGIYVHDPVPLADRQFVNPSQADDAGVVHGDIQATELDFYLFDQAIDAVRVAHVDLQRHGAAPQCTNPRSRFLGDTPVIVGDRDVGARLRQAQGDALTDATTGARDKGDLAREGEIKRSCFAHVMPLVLVIGMRPPVANR